ncbi:MAG: ABC transporter permease [Verrucomicrobia bacterium]|nr:ABC transporter permease [Verrucomicrobiota bacterium]MBU1909709.1 ABC transporter permease [Verrucomicrobiota bacterium]
MKTFLTLWRKELAAYFLSPIAYVVMIFFLVVFGFSFWLLVSVLVQGPAGVSVMQELFGSLFFWITLLVAAPVLTMRLFTEEKTSGTLETLMTAPVTDTEVVLAKYFGALGFYLILWLPTVAYAVVLRAFSPLTASVDLGPMLGGYLGALLVGAFYLSVGVFCSSLASNQIMAAISCFAGIGVVFFAGFMAFLARSDAARDAFAYISSVSHMLDFARGLVDTRPIILYVTLTAFMLFAAVKVIESRRWK